MAKPTEPPTTTQNTEHISEQTHLPPEHEQLPYLWTSIPHTAEREWVIVCSRVCQQICDAEDNDSLHHAILQLLLLPRRVLCRVACQRGAARAPRSLFRYSSVQQAVPVGTDPHPLDQEQHSDTRTLRARAISKASTLMKAGHKIRAVRTLLQDALLLNVTDEVVSQLNELHPASTAALPIPDNEWTSLYLKEQYSQRFYDKGAAPGPSGWTGAMIIPLLENVVCRKALAIVFTQIINGSIPNGMLNQTLRAARLIPLSKPTPGVRPIAVSETFMRVAASTVLRSSPFDLCFHLYSLGWEGQRELRVLC